MSYEATLEKINIKKKRNAKARRRKEKKEEMRGDPKTSLWIGLRIL